MLSENEAKAADLILEWDGYIGVLDMPLFEAAKTLARKIRIGGVGSKATKKKLKKKEEDRLR